MNQVWQATRLFLSIAIGVIVLGFFATTALTENAAYWLAGRSANTEDLAMVTAGLGQDRNWLLQFLAYFQAVIQLDFGYSWATGEPATAAVIRAVPNSIALVLPGFVLGHIGGLLLGSFAARATSERFSALISGLAIAGMSVSFLVTALFVQWLLCSPDALNLLPITGWSNRSAGSYLNYVAAPTLTILLATLGLNFRLYRTLWLEVFRSSQFVAARALSVSSAAFWDGWVWRFGLKSIALPVFTRIIYSLPLTALAGSIVLEYLYNVPGAGRLMVDAVNNFDQPLLLSLLVLSGLAFAGVSAIGELLNPRLDPRLKGR